MAFSPKQNLALLKLVVTGETTLQSQFRPQLTAKERNELLNAGLVELLPSPKGRGKQLAATDKAWGWAEENLVSPISRSQEAAALLHQLLRTIDAFLERQDLRFADLFNTHSTEVASPEELVQDAVRALVSDSPSADIRLKDLRDALPEIPRDELDQTLLQLAHQRKLEFHHMDDPLSMDERDHAAAISILGFEKQLVRWLK